MSNGAWHWQGMGKPRKMQIWTREGAEGQYFHVIARINGRFRCLDEEAKEMFAKLMRQAEAFSGVEIVTWTILDNHFHLVVYVPAVLEEGELADDVFWARLGALYSGEALAEIRLQMASFQQTPGGLAGIAMERAYRLRFVGRMHHLSEFMKTLLQRFSTWFNKRVERVGRLWEARFKSVVIEGGWDPLMNVAAYVDLNAVRAGIVKDPKDYRWSGYAEAVVGSRWARRGLGKLMRDEALRLESPVPDWRVIGREYRKLLFGIGEELRLPDGGLLRKGIPGESVRNVEALGGQLPIAMRLRSRIRYFTDGVVIGSQGFVESFFEAKKEYFGPKRTSGARKLRNGDWGVLRSLRDLQT